MKNESDEELECREHRFVLYADDGMFFLVKAEITLSIIVAKLGRTSMLGYYL